MSMNLDFLWLTGALQLLVLFVVGPVIAVAIALCGMATKATELQPQAVRDVVRRVRRDCFSAIGGGEVDQRRRQNCAVLPAISLRLVWRPVTWCGCWGLDPGTLHVWRWHKITSLADPNQTE